MSQDIEKVMTAYYGGDKVSAIITMKVDTKEADRIADKISKFDSILDLFLVTGDTDIIAKARFADYRALKEFLVESLAAIPGIKDTKTLMVVTTYKEAGATK